MLLYQRDVLDFCYSKQLCLCVIELHMGVNIQRYADVRMTHDILQCLWIHSGFRHIRTEGVPAYMRGDVRQRAVRIKLLVLLHCPAHLVFDV